jgi:peptidoglycan/LPS O-acetylase OafA/YrhL
VGRPPPAGVRRSRSLTATIAQAGEVRSARVESLRALAAVAVLVGHALLIANAGLPPDSAKNRILIGGGLGVFLFFTLTGYLLWLPFARGGVDVVRYARNRALRILPLYWAVVAILYLVQPSGARTEDWWRFALFLQNYSADTAARLDSPMWTLVVEVQFYVLLPLLALAISALARGSLARAAALVAALGLASFALRLDRVLLADGTDYTGVLGKFSLPTLFFFFTSGMLLALLRLHLERTGRRLPGTPSAWLLTAAGLWLLACVDYEWEPVVYAAGFVTVGACVLPLGGGPGLARVLEWRPLAALGVASYSLYLWHVPVLLWVSGQTVVFEDSGANRFAGAPDDFKAVLAGGLAAAIVVAAASYLVIERPFLRLRRRWAPTAAAREASSGSSASPT